MEIVPGVRVVTDRIDATTLTVTLIGESEAVVVDTGLPTTPDNVILPYLASLDRAPTWIRTIVDTHCHTDHAGGNGRIVAASNARVLVHEIEAPYVADPLSFVRMMGARYGNGQRAPDPDPDEVKRLYGTGTPVDATLADGDRISIDGREWEVIHTPGHSPGGICLYEAETGTLITGDAVQAEGTTSCDLAFYFEAEDYERSVARVAALKVDVIIAGHPFKPFPTSVMRSVEARRFLEVSRNAPIRYREQVQATLRDARGAMSTAEIAAVVTRLNGFDRCVGPAIQTTRAHLEQLRARGEVARLYRDGTWCWRR
jgi:glyoxylase-like metal-dependent hydrolase (beta-lactamase superfamily II)